MKIKLHFKALDNHEEDLKNTKKDLEIIEDFYRAKYMSNNDMEDLSIYDSDRPGIRIVSWKEGVRIYLVSINYEFKQAAKGIQPSMDWTPFEKDELKLFDMLDYELHPVYKKNVKQDITDWTKI